MHRKIFIAFILLPLLTLFVFSIMLLMLMDGIVIKNSILFIGTLLGTIGFSLVFTIILRAKKIRIEESYFVISQIFSGQKYEVKPEDIVSYDFQKVKEGKGLGTNKYELLEVKRLDGKFNYFLSYELKEFEKLKNWLINREIRRSRLSYIQMMKSEFLSSFIFGLLTSMILLVYCLIEIS